MNVSRGARVVTDDVHSKSWETMSKVERQALRTTIQTFKGATFGNKLADGTPLCEMMLWKVFLADSCGRKWIGNGAALSKAAEDYADAKNEFRDLLESRADSLSRRVEVAGDIFRDALMVQASLDPPDVPPPPTGAGALPAEIAMLEAFLDDVGIAQRQQVVGRFKGVHQLLRRDDPALKGVAVLIILSKMIC